MYAGAIRGIERSDVDAGNRAPSSGFAISLAATDTSRPGGRRVLDVGMSARCVS